MADSLQPGRRNAESVVQIQASDGYSLKYRVWVPQSGGARAVLMLLNGVMSHSLWFYPLAPVLLAQGFKLVGADRRGTGLNDIARGDAPNAKALLDDAHAIADHEREAGRPFHLVGWCWGAVLSINLAAEMRGALSSLVLVAPGLFPTLELKQRIAEEEQAADALPGDRAYLESPVREDMFTAGPALTDFILRDEHRLGRFTPRFHRIMGKLGMGARLAMPKLDLPTLLILAREDLVTDNAETERNFARWTGGRAVVEYVESAHGMQFDAPDELARRIGAWAATFSR